MLSIFFCIKRAIKRAPGIHIACETADVGGIDCKASVSLYNQNKCKII